MSNDYFNPPNSVWPNGLKRDGEGFVTFYPLGTNKVNSSEITMPEGDVLKAPYVYKAGNLVGFVDDKALNGETFNLPYKQVSMEIGGQPVEINLDDECDAFIVTLTKATTGPIINKRGINEVETVYDINAPEMTSAAGMFSNRKIKSIKLHIPKLTDATDMFSGCELTSEIIYEILDSIPKGNGSNYINLGATPTDITEEELVNAFAEKGWVISDMEYMDIHGNVSYSTNLTSAQQKLLEDTVAIVNNECFDETEAKIGNFDTNAVTSTTNIAKLVIDLEPLLDLMEYEPAFVSESINTVITEDEPIEDEEEILLEILEEVIKLETTDGDKPRSITLPKLRNLSSDMSSLKNIAAFGASILNSLSSEIPFIFNTDLSKLKKFSIEAEFKNLDTFLFKLIELDSGASMEGSEIPVEVMSSIGVLIKLFIPLIESSITSFLKSNIFANTDIEIFNSNLSSLENGNEMFSKTNIAYFNANLNSLIKAKGMFGLSEEDAQKYIDYFDNLFNVMLQTIPFVTNPSISASSSNQGSASVISDSSSDSSSDPLGDLINSLGNAMDDVLTGVVTGLTQGSNASTAYMILSLIFGAGGILSFIKLLSANSPSGSFNNLELCQMEKLLATGLSGISDTPDSSSSGSPILDLGFNRGLADTSLNNLSENISDLKTKNIIHNENTGEGHIDITVLYNGRTLEEVKADIDKLTDKGWNCSAIVSSSYEDPETNDVVNYIVPVYNYKKPSRFLVDYRKELQEITTDIPEYKIVDNQIYDIDNNLKGSINFNNIAYYSPFSLSLDSESSEGSDESSNWIPFENITSFDCNLSNAKTLIGMFSGSSKLTTFNGDLSNLRSGLMLFAGCENLTSFNSDLSNLEIGIAMFTGCDLDEASLKNISSTIKDVKGDGLYHIINIGKGTHITDDIRNDFINKGWIVLNDDNHNLCYKFPLDTQKIIDNTNGIINNECFDINLVKVGDLDTSTLNTPALFFQNKAIEGIMSDFTSLTNGYKFFSGCSNLKVFKGDLSSLVSGDNMFENSSNLQQFEANTSSLTNGDKMFEQCVNLVSFRGDLSSLTSGNGMFVGCKLDTASLQHIAETINPDGSGTLTLGIGNATPTEEEIIALNAIHDKGWDVSVNGSSYSPTTPAAVVTLDENGEEIVTPIPYYAKPVETNVFKAKYIGEDNKFYTIKGGQFIFDDDKDSYGMFTCEADAAANMRLSTINKENALPALKSAINNEILIKKAKSIKNRVKGPLSKININNLNLV